MTSTPTPTHSNNRDTIQSSTADIAAALAGESLSDSEDANERNPKAHRVADRVGDLGGSGEPRGDSERTTEDSERGDILWVDWEGPGDAMNPKK
jgi:hypothetical protein